MIRGPLLVPLEGDVELALVDPARHADRLYGLTVTRTLWGEPALLLAWGRRGSPLRRRVETFATDDALARRRHELLLRRRQHGYRLVGLRAA